MKPPFIVDIYCPCCYRVLVVIHADSHDVRPHRVCTEPGWVTTTEWPYPVECKGCGARGFVDAIRLIYARHYSNRRRVRIPLTLIGSAPRALRVPAASSPG
jgi:hypothetical protein